MKPAFRLLFWLAVVAWVAVDLFVTKGPLCRVLDHTVKGGLSPTIATVNGQTISRNDVIVSLREQLWRRGLNWDDMASDDQKAQAQETLEALVDLQLVRTAAAGTESPKLGAANEMETLRRMLQFEDTRLQQCLSSQQLSEQQLVARMAAQLADQRWLEPADGDANDLTSAQTWFAARQPSQVPERYHAAHIFLSGHERDKPERQGEMEAIAAKLQADPASFGDLARTFSDDERTKLRGGDLGWFAEARMPKDFMQPLKALKVGETSGIIRTSLGWHLVKLIETKSAEALAFESVSAEARAYQRNLRVVPALREKLGGLRHAASLNKDEEALAEACKAIVVGR